MNNRRKISFHSSATGVLTLGLAVGLSANLTGDLSEVSQLSSSEDYAQLQEMDPAERARLTTRPPPRQNQIPPPPVEEDARDPVTPRPTVGRAAPRNFIKNATRLLDQPIENHLGEQLGAVTDFVINANTNQLEFVAVGPGQELRLVPPQAVQTLNDDRLVANVTMDQWDDAPTIPRENLAMLAGEDEASEVYAYYGLEYPPSGPMDRAREARIQSDSRPRGVASQHRTAQPLRRPGEPQRLASEPYIIPRDQAEIHPELRWTREYGMPPERDPDRPRSVTEWSGRRWERDTDLQDTTEFGARTPGPTFQPRPGLRNPRMRSTSRAAGPMHDAGERPSTPAPEFGAPPEWRSSALAPEERLKWASDLIGNPVVDRNGQAAGEVADFIVNLRSGRVQHVIVSDEQRDLAIPMRVTRIGEDGTFTVRPTVEALQRAPRYDRSQARLRPQQPFLYDEAPEPEFGAPARGEPGTQGDPDTRAGMPPNVGPDRAPEVRREARDRSAQGSE